MSYRIPLASNIVPGLMSQEDKVKLDSIPNNITTLFSGSTIQSHQLSSSYFSMSSGSINDLQISRTLIVNGPSNITGTPVPDPLSSSIQRSNQLSASYFSMSSGSINDLLISRTLTGSLQSSIKAHQLSSSYFSMSSGSINDLLISRTLTGSLQSSIKAHQLSSSYFSMSSGSINDLLISRTLIVNGPSNITGTPIPDPLSSSVQRNHQLSSSYFSMSSGSINNIRIKNIAEFEGSTIFYISSYFQDGMEVENNAYFYGLLDYSQITGSINRSNQLSASYFSMSSGSINDLLISRTLTGSLQSSIKAHQLSASYFSMSSGSINRLRSRYISSPSGQELELNSTTNIFLNSDLNINHQSVGGQYFNADTVEVNVGSGMTLQSFNNDINLRTGDKGGSGSINMYAGPLGDVHIFSPTYLYDDLLVGATNITASVSDPLSSSVQRNHQLSSSYFSMSSGSINNLRVKGVAQFDNTTTFNSAVDYNSNVNFFNGPLYFDAISAYFDGGSIELATGWISSSFSRNAELSASYFSMSSGSINNLSINTMQLSGVAIVSPVSSKVLFENFNVNVATTTNIPLLSQSINSGETWTFNYNLPVVLTGTGGIRFTVYAPTGSIIEGFVDGRTTTAASTSRIRLSTINTELASTFNNATLIIMPQYINFTIRNGNNSGNVTVGVRRVTGTDFCHIISGSYMISTKVT